MRAPSGSIEKRADVPRIAFKDIEAPHGVVKL